MILLNDLQRHNLSLEKSLKTCIDQILKNGWYVLGNEVKSFENEFSQYCQTNNCISVANGTDALELALRALGVTRGHQVITVANAGGYSTIALWSIGATPVYVDIDSDTQLISIEDLEKRLNKNIAAVIVTHLYGHAAPVYDIVELISKYNIPLIEDCAQAHGAMINGKRVGSFGKLGCFSFYPTKNLGALGDGGAIVTDDLELAQRVTKLRQYGWERKYKSVMEGGRNSRLDELQAALLRIKLPLLDTWNARRFAICERYTDGITHSLVKTPRITAQSFVGHLFVVRTSRRDSLQNYLKNREIFTDIHYPIPDYRQPFCTEQYANLRLKETEMASAEVLSLPCFPEMTDFEVDAVITAVNEWPGI